ncbi:LuxE/PaaK family acyltransferase [Tepidibacter sp. Z1-5]|uniref:LuxE/PaaK family acyltransferase n=1 Tax=Tepidibacter sp. Z1-5 TaxID=3134138 RepID=UPI0030C16E4E
MMFDIVEILQYNPYSLDKSTKENLLIDKLKEITKFHKSNCKEYEQIINGLDIDIDKIQDIEKIPFLPVRLFKDYELLSVDKGNVIKIMTSSGTTGQRVSKIFLDRENATNQTKVLTKIVSSFIGNRRLPMLILDTSAIVKNRNLFSARAAGILGFSMFGRDHTYALDENMNLNIDKIQEFLGKYQGQPILLFGFTYMIWEYIYNKIKIEDIKLDFSNGILIHGGGWKKLIDQQVDNKIFKESLKQLCGLDKIYNYYGMVEQTGSIYMECEYGHFHTPIFSDIIIRNFTTFKPEKTAQEGLIQVISLLPNSYPGHSILTEDIGQLLGEDDCPCGRFGKYFKIKGRLRNAEIRGCSDTYESK